ARSGVRERETSAHTNNTNVLPGCAHAIRREPLRQIGIVPIGVEHERRKHHHSASSIEPLLLFARSWQADRIHQRNFPLKLDAASITLLQFCPRRLGPKTPG